MAVDGSPTSILPAITVTSIRTADSFGRSRLACVLVLLGLLATVRGTPFKSVVIQTGGQAGETERNVASLLAERISEPSGIPVRIIGGAATATPPDTELVILLGVPEHHAGIRGQFDAQRIPPLTGLAPGKCHLEG